MQFWRAPPAETLGLDCRLRLSRGGMLQVLPAEAQLDHVGGPPLKKFQKLPQGIQEQAELGIEPEFWGLKGETE